LVVADTPDDRVHHLLALLSSPDVDTATEVGSTAAEPAFSMRGDVSAAPTEYGGDGDASSETGAYANGNGVADEYDNDYDDPQRTPVMSVAGLRGASLNFLQEDELALPAPQVDVNFRAVHAQHEVIEPASAVNVSLSFLLRWN
jgi:hypothetical protein